MSEKQQSNGRTAASQASQIVPILVLVFLLVIGAGLWLLKQRSSQLMACRQHNWAAATYNDRLLDECVGKGISECDNRRVYVRRLQEANWQTIQPGNPLLADCAGLKACEERRDYRPPTDKCRQHDWTRVNYNDPLLLECAGKGIPEYEKRRAFIDGLKKIDWASVRSDDAVLRDCAGWEPCTLRANQLIAPPPSSPSPTPKTVPPKKDPRLPPPPPARVDWTTAACDLITPNWEPEDQRLSTCQGLSPAACARIKRCLGVNDTNVGPGVKQ